MLLDKFNNKQMEFLKSIDINIDTQKAYTDDEAISIHESVTDYLTTHGFDDDYAPNEEGMICESIIDVFYDKHDI